MMRLRALAASLTIPIQPVSQLCAGNLIIVREISSGRPICVIFGTLLDERDHLQVGVRELGANPVRSMSANSRRSDAKRRPSGDEKRATGSFLSIKAKTTDNATLSVVVIRRQARRFYRNKWS
ncbi:hypothetical protein, partial [Bradyrhizobium liaoningense]